mmetsp:Transcript_4528/g.9032  ORF Transcript_4528/g.9032 Transcript_4528/m.9032 type:complete len:115 (+) Transcript_4528:1317-1661(+)
MILFERDPVTRGWRPIDNVTASGSPGFGGALAAEGGVVVVGASTGSNGTAFIYVVEPTPTPLPPPTPTPTPAHVPPYDCWEASFHSPRMTPDVEPRFRYGGLGWLWDAAMEITP